MKNLAKTFAHSLAAVGMSAALVAPAFAAAPSDDSAPRRIAKIEVADLNLATPAGQRKLDRRIESAVREVCRTADIKTGTRIINREAQDCHARARAEAKSQVAARISEAQRGG